ncbi:MAG: N-acetylmuramoyl-L-alanine amidase [Lachnospiraceae bacterium]|nr:N-acetylmuramoyl-L-alanine amidase [Lachnospiraceae bacterium]
MRGKWAIFIAVLFSLLFVAGVGTMLAMGNKSGDRNIAADGNGQGSAVALTGDTTGRENADSMLASTGNRADGNLSGENAGDAMQAENAVMDGNAGEDLPALTGDETAQNTGADQIGNSTGNAAVDSSVSDGNALNGIATDGNAGTTVQDGQSALSQEESDRINLELARRLRSTYDKIVVLDPGHGGTDSGLVAAPSDAPETELAEKELALQVALKVKEILEQKQVCVILTRDTDMTVGESSRALIANGMPADLFISLHARSDADTTLHGMSAVYNASFYSPRIQNAELAYDLLKNMEDATKEKSLGMFDADRDADIMSLMIPSVELSLGQLSNAQDVKLLMRDDYRDKLASGIADGILASFDRMEDNIEE